MDDLRPAELSSLDLACLSYTAATRVLRLERYPPWNEGAEIRSEDSSFAGDGPLVAGFAAGLGLTVGLETNAVAYDQAGHEVLAFLERNSVAHDVASTATRTPHAYILSHPDAAREWLVDLQQAAADLASVDGALVRRAQLVYVDCFASISTGARRGLELAAQHNRVVYANLGTLSFGDDLEHVLKATPLAAVQASVREEEASVAVEVARELATRFDAPLVYVTLSSYGAIALQGSEIAVAPARAVDVDYTHGAGAAFSAGAIYGRSRGWALGRTLEFACALGSMQCTSERCEAPSEEKVHEFIAATKPAPSVAVASDQAP